MARRHTLRLPRPVAGKQEAATVGRTASCLLGIRRSRVACERPPTALHCIRYAYAAAIRSVGPDEFFEDERKVSLLRTTLKGSIG